MTKEQFIKKYINKIVKCDTKEKVKELYKLTKEFGFATLSEMYWEDTKTLCFRFGMYGMEGYANISHYQTNKNYEGIPIVDFEHSEEHIKETENMLNMLINKKK